MEDEWRWISDMSSFVSVMDKLRELKIEAATTLLNELGEKLDNMDEDFFRCGERYRVNFGCYCDTRSRFVDKSLASNGFKQPRVLDTFEPILFHGVFSDVDRECLEKPFTLSEVCLVVMGLVYRRRWGERLHVLWDVRWVLGRFHILACRWGWIRETDPSLLNDTHLHRFAEVGNKLVDATGKVIHGYFRKKFEILDREDLSPVKIVDQAAKESMVSIIMENFPSHAIYGEEKGWRCKEESADYV
ncbi:hypothetical protein V6N11_075588 [Hibiscus sabdariffa]|uniref:Uncharacterized protein n=1 Tax=Hibiscus sabdariffa TaxID=183260 RepID=A0ABR2R7A4_9ROSI